MTRRLIQNIWHKKPKNMISIREEQPQDKQTVRKVNLRSFGQSQEADIVDKLRKNCNECLSLVALKKNQIVGHILFTPVVIEGKDKTVRGMGLAPMAVLPQYRRQGIGSELIRAGIARLKSRQFSFVIVLGHAKYYPQFGFEPASRYGIFSEWEVPDEAFMILVLNKSEIEGLSGVAKYRPEFSEAV